MEETFYILKLNNCFNERKRKNKIYSLRAYARDLGIHPATLSAVLKKKRTLPLAQTLRLCEQLKLSEGEKDQFIKSIYLNKFWQFHKTVGSNINKDCLSNSLHFKIIAEWEYFAVYTLFDTRRVLTDSLAVAQSLQIEPQRAKEVIDNLIALGWLITDQGQLHKIENRPKTTTEDIPSRAIQLGHLEELRLAQEKLVSVDVLQRDYSSNYMAINPSQLPKAKQLIREFRKKMEAILEKPPQTEVYLLSLQLFPLAISTQKRALPKRKGTQ